MQLRHLLATLQALDDDMRVVDMNGNVPLIWIEEGWRIETQAPEGDATRQYVEYCGTEAAANRRMQELGNTGHQLLSIEKSKALVLG